MFCKVYSASKNVYIYNKSLLISYQIYFYSLLIFQVSNVYGLIINL